MYTYVYAYVCVWEKWAKLYYKLHLALSIPLSSNLELDLAGKFCVN